jgi:hypothetical protein
MADIVRVTNAAVYYEPPDEEVPLKQAITVMVGGVKYQVIASGWILDTWPDDIAPVLVEYDAEHYADDVEPAPGLRASEKLIAKWTSGRSLLVKNVPYGMRCDFEAELYYRLGAVKNLEISKAIHPNILNRSGA